MKNKARLTRISAILGAAFFLSVLIISVAQAMGPEITILPEKVEYKRNVTAVITGSGFKPNQEIGLRVEMGGVLSDISYLVNPRPVTNANGSFATIWVLNREIRGKLIKLGTHDLTAVDEDGKELAVGKLSFKKAKAAKKKKK